MKQTQTSSSENLAFSVQETIFRMGSSLKYDNMVINFYQFNPFNFIIIHQ